MVSFMSLPAELRLEVYKYLMPGPKQYPSAYSGLRSSCRLICKEYDHEADKVIPSIYNAFPHPLVEGRTRYYNWHVTHRPSAPQSMADLATVDIRPTLYVPGRMAAFPKRLVPLDRWTWLKTLVLTFNVSHWLARREDLDPAHKKLNECVRFAYERFDRLIKSHTGTSVYQHRFGKCEVDTFVLRWDGYKLNPRPPYTRFDFDQGKWILGDPAVVVPAPALGLPSNHDRLWDVTFGFDDNGCFVEAVWRRRTQLDAQRDAEDDFMPLPEWLDLAPPSYEDEDAWADGYICEDSGTVGMGYSDYNVRYVTNLRRPLSSRVPVSQV